MDTIFVLSAPQNPQTRYKLQVHKNPVYRNNHYIYNSTKLGYWGLFEARKSSLNEDNLFDKAPAAPLAMECE